MNITTTPAAATAFFTRYRVHLMIFLIVFFVGLTIAHPRILLTDEWITTNQLSQLHSGHQVITNEGKYGSYDNGDISYYFEIRSNALGYSLFLPVISLPAYWTIDIVGFLYAFFILYLWTLLGLLLLVMIDNVFPQFARIGNWRWTPVGYGAAFLIFFLNLYLYAAFPVQGPGSFSEILAIVFTNIALLAILGVIIYDISLTIFEDVQYSVFSTAACLSCSSYFFWLTGCKDHILVALLFAAVLMCLIKYLKSREYWFFPLAFLFAGLLAWARPEVAFWVFISTCLIWAFVFISSGVREKSLKDYAGFIVTPFFTAVGAVPFLLNNYLVSRNFLRPTMMLYNLGELAPSQTSITPVAATPVAGDSVQVLIRLIVVNTTPDFSSMLSDLLGIFFLPQNHSIGIFILAPLAFVGIVTLLVYHFHRKTTLTPQEKQHIFLLILFCICTLFAYLRGLNGLNISLGIMPDIRYLSPIYLPLTLIGLIVIRKCCLFAETPLEILKRMGIFWIIAIPLSLIPLAGLRWDPVDALLNFEILRTVFTALMVFVIVIAIFGIVSDMACKRAGKYWGVALPVLCALPFVWQIDSSFLMWQYGLAEAYTFWIPVVQTVISSL
jgi:hypothetical protein